MTLFECLKKIDFFFPFFKIPNTVIVLVVEEFQGSFSQPSGQLESLPGCHSTLPPPPLLISHHTFMFSIKRAIDYWEGTP